MLLLVWHITSEKVLPFGTQRCFFFFYIIVVLCIMFLLVYALYDSSNQQVNPTFNLRNSIC